MTCFWDGILNALTNEDFARGLTLAKSPTIYAFAALLKERNIRTENVSWNGIPFTAKQLEENYTAVENYDSRTMRQGYLCSTCDYFLPLVCELFRLNINHNYNGHMMTYRYGKPESGRTLEFYSDTGHFQNGRGRGILSSLSRILPEKKSHQILTGLAGFYLLNRLGKKRRCSGI
jgi:hypothetical protein